MYNWQVTDLFLKNSETNDLVKKLNKLQIDVWDRSKTYHLGKRMMLGANEINDKLTYFSISWEEDVNEHAVEPLTFQIPENTIVDSGFMFSSDGNWVATTGQKRTGMYKIPELFLYSADKKFPQRLSPPIRCGYTKDSNPGTFIDHEKFGPLFIEQDSDYPKKLFIYKLTGGLKLLSGLDS